MFKEDFIPTSLNLIPLEGSFSICQLDPNSEVPAWAFESDFYSITRTPDELSIICNRLNIPKYLKCDSDWRVLKIDGTFPFDEIGILNAITMPLAEANISLLTVSTYDTDLILVKESHFEQAVRFLESAGHSLSR